MPFLLPRLHAFFRTYLIAPDVRPHDGWFEYEDVPLKWHYPVGLLFDLYAGTEPAQDDLDAASALKEAARLGGHTGSSEPSTASAATTVLPWRLTLHFADFPASSLIRLDADGKVLHDAFVNSVKEADFLRNGTAKPVMSLSKPDSQQLWDSLQRHDLNSFNVVHQKLLTPPGVELRHVPLRVYLPQQSAVAGAGGTEAQTVQEIPVPAKGVLRVVQGQVPPAQKNSRTSPPHHVFLPRRILFCRYCKVTTNPVIKVTRRRWALL